jgi:hypothetical protein
MNSAVAVLTSDRVFGAVHPEDRASHAVEPLVQAVAVTQLMELIRTRFRPVSPVWFF